jgi:hypothetical protein
MRDLCTTWASPWKIPVGLQVLFVPAPGLTCTWLCPLGWADVSQMGTPLHLSYWSSCPHLVQYCVHLLATRVFPYSSFSFTISWPTSHLVSAPSWSSLKLASGKAFHRGLSCRRRAAGFHFFNIGALQRNESTHGFRFWYLLPLLFDSPSLPFSPGARV